MAFTTGKVITAASSSIATTALTGTLQAAQMPALTGDVTTAGGALAATIAANAVDNTKAAQIATNRIKGRATAGTGNVEDLTAAQVNTMLGTATLTGAESLTNKTLDNTNTVTLKDTLFTLQDDGDTTKQAKFQLSGITTATTRTYTFPDVNGTLVLNNLTTTTLGSQTISTTLNIGNGVTASGSTKTVNVGTAGASGSTTAINIGSAVSGATSTTTISGPVTTSTYVKTTATTVASLTAAATAGAGARHFVTDASTTLALGVGTVVAGGGANGVPVHSDGTNWRIG